MTREKPTLLDQNRQRDKAWLEKYDIPPGGYLLEQTDTDVGVVMGSSYTDPPPRILATFIEALEISEQVTDPDIQVAIFDSNRDLVYSGYPAKH